MADLTAMIGSERNLADTLYMPMGLAVALRTEVTRLTARLAEHAAATAAQKVFPHDYGWDDLITLLDAHWPTDIFPVAPDSAAREAGPRLLSLARHLTEQAARDSDVAQLTARLTLQDGVIARLRAGAAEMTAHADFNAAQTDPWWRGHTLARREDADHIRAILAPLDPPPPGSTTD